MRHLTIQAMSKLSGVSSHTLRAWERRYGAIEPQRTDSNRRLYSYSDLEKIRLLKDLTDQGHGIGAIAPMNLDQLKELLGETVGEFENGAANENLSALHRQTEQEKLLVAEILDCVKAYDLPSINRKVSMARVSLGAPRFVLHVASPVFQNVGRLVATGQLTMSQEHALSAILRNQFTQLVMSLAPLADPDLPTFALCTKEGDYHEFGILLTAVLCAHEGFPLVYFGPNLPARSLAEATNALGLKNVIIGSTPLPPEFMVTTLPKYLKELRGYLKEDCGIWLGGYMEDLTHDEIETLSIDTFSSFGAALERLNEIKSKNYEESR